MLRADVAYQFKETDNGEGIPIGLLKAQKAIVLDTSNTKNEREQNTFGDPLENLWKTCIFDPCGIKNFYRKIFSVIITKSNWQREKWLKETREIIANQFKKEEGNSLKSCYDRILRFYDFS